MSVVERGIQNVTFPRLTLGVENYVGSMHWFDSGDETSIFQFAEAHFTGAAEARLLFGGNQDVVLPVIPRTVEQFDPFFSAIKDFTGAVFVPLHGIEIMRHMHRIIDQTGLPFAFR